MAARDEGKWAIHKRFSGCQIYGSLGGQTMTRFQASDGANFRDNAADNI